MAIEAKKIAEWSLYAANASAAEFRFDSPDSLRVVPQHSAREILATEAVPALLAEREEMLRLFEDLRDEYGPQDDAPEECAHCADLWVRLDAFLRESK